MKAKLPIVAAIVASLLLVVMLARQSSLERQVSELRAKAREVPAGRKVEFRHGAESVSTADDAPAAISPAAPVLSTPAERLGQISDSLAGQREVVDVVRKRLAKRDERATMIYVREGMKRVVSESLTGRKVQSGVQSTTGTPEFLRHKDPEQPAASSEKLNRRSKGQ